MTISEFEIFSNTGYDIKLLANMSSKLKSVLLVKGNKGKSVTMIKPNLSVTISANRLPQMGEETVSTVRLSEGTDPSAAISNRILEERSSQFLNVPNSEIESKLSMTPSKKKIKRKGKQIYCILNIIELFTT